jgi:hypothetical protein
MKGIGSSHRILIKKSDRKRSLVRPKGRWENNIYIAILKNISKLCCRLIWLWIGTSGGLL